MAEKKASLKIQLKDEASKELGGVTKSVGDFKYGILAVAGAVTGFVAAMYSMAKSAMEQETAVNKLNLSMKNNGSYTDSASADLQNFANELQRTTAIGDETAIEMMALLGTFGLTGAELKRATMAAADLSTGLGVDLHQAAMMVGRAYEGNTSMISRYTGEIEKGATSAETYANALEKVNGKVGGSAQAELLTMTGRVANLGNQFDDLKEKLGAGLMPVLEKLVEWGRVEVESIGVLVEQFSNWQGVIATLGETMVAFFGNVLIGITAFIEAMPGASFLFEKMGLDADVMTQKVQAGIDTINGKIQGWANNAVTQNQKVMASDNSYTQNKSKNNAKELAEASAKAMKEGALQADLTSKIKAMEDKRLEEKIARDKKEQEINIAKFDAFRGMLSNLATFQTAKSKELAMVGKAAGIAQATVDTYMAANKALSSAPPPWSYGLAAATIAVGLANVARISGVQLAEGGMVRPRNGGISATIAEAGSAEAVIPLDDPETKEKLADVMGGNTINITAGTIIADNMSVREFAKRIDEELFQLQRNRQTVSI